MRMLSAISWRSNGFLGIISAMTRVAGLLTGRALFPLVFILSLLLTTGSALASPIAIHEVGGMNEMGSTGTDSSAYTTQSLLVPGRPPTLRVRSASGPFAGISSKHVNQSAGEGTRTNGKIVAIDHHRGSYSCSGTALNTPSRSIVITAGHCVIEGGSIGDRIVFIPAYNHHRRPFGSFEAEAVYVTRQWRRYENPAFDVAALKVKPNQLGSLTDVVGSRGYVTSKSRFTAFEIFGYPASALRGEELRSCRAHGLGTDLLTNSFFGPPTIPASCDMAGGSSGGGWIVKDEFINGVTSYAYGNRSTRLYSPYFGPTIANFLRKLP